MSIDTKHLGRVIAEIRESRGLTQREVAEKTGLTINYLSLVENGVRGVSIEGLNKLAKVFKIPAEFITFLAGSGSKKAEFAELSNATKDTIWALIEAQNS